MYHRQSAIIDTFHAITDFLEANELFAAERLDDAQAECVPNQTSSIRAKLDFAIRSRGFEGSVRSMSGHATR